jgi:hypothetical protein
LKPARRVVAEPHPQPLRLRGRGARGRVAGLRRRRRCSGVRKAVEEDDGVAGLGGRGAVLAAVGLAAPQRRQTGRARREAAALEGGREGASGWCV